MVLFTVPLVLERYRGQESSFCATGSPSTTIPSTAAASGGDGSITYQWKKGSSVLASSNSATFTLLSSAGTYTREAKDGTCNNKFYWHRQVLGW